MNKERPLQLFLQGLSLVFGSEGAVDVDGAGVNPLGAGTAAGAGKAVGALLRSGQAFAQCPACPHL